MPRRVRRYFGIWRRCSLLPWCDTAYVTRIHAAFPADVVFPNLDRDPDWELAEEEPPLEQDGLFFHYVRYRRIR